MELGISQWSRGFLRTSFDWWKCGNRVGIEAEPFGREAGFRVEVVWLLVGVLFSCLCLGST